MGQFYVNGDGVTTTATADGNQITISAMGGGAGSWILLESQTASNDATIEFTTTLTGYTTYAFVMNRILPTESADLEGHISDDGGSTWDPEPTWYRSGCNYQVYNSTSLGDGGNGNTSCIFKVNGMISDSYDGTSWVLYLTTAPGQLPYFWGEGFGQGAVFYSMGQNIVLTNVVNGFQWKYSTGNIASGTFALYGIKQV